MAKGTSPVKTDVNRDSFLSNEKPNFGTTNDMSAKLEMILKQQVEEELKKN